MIQRKPSGKGLWNVSFYASSWSYFTFLLREVSLDIKEICAMYQATDLNKKFPILEYFEEDFS